MRPVSVVALAVSLLGLGCATGRDLSTVNRAVVRCGSTELHRTSVDPQRAVSRIVVDPGSGELTSGTMFSVRSARGKLRSFTAVHCLEGADSVWIGDRPWANPPRVKPVEYLDEELLEIDVPMSLLLRREPLRLPEGRRPLPAGMEFQLFGWPSSTPVFSTESAGVCQPLVVDCKVIELPHRKLDDRYVFAVPTEPVQLDGFSGGPGVFKDAPGVAELLFVATLRDTITESWFPDVPILRWLGAWHREEVMVFLRIPLEKE